MLRVVEIKIARSWRLGGELGDVQGRNWGGIGALLAEIRHEAWSESKKVGPSLVWELIELIGLLSHSGRLRSLEPS